RGALFRESAEGMIQNSYTLKIQNKAQTGGEYRISATCDSFRIRLDDGGDRVRLAAGELATLPVMIEADPADITTRN
ncbi:FixG Ig-like domain-containing protein, partial [Acinetobacter baumannii]